MKAALPLHRLLILAAPVLLAVPSGCSDGHARYTPVSSEAAAALEKALTAWRDGKPYGVIDTKPPVQVVDLVWQEGQQIESFQIGTEEDPGDGTKQFAVKLKMKKPAGEKDVRYVVHGRDPIWVFRDEDYKRALNMENNPVTSQPKSGLQRSGRSRR